jgi:hypothetical protein
MKNEILLIQDKLDVERDLIAEVWTNCGGKVIRVGKFWEKPNIGSERITIYGNHTFALVLSQVVDVELLQINDEIISSLDFKWIKRKINILKISDIDETFFPTFIKPVNPKIFKSKIYDNYDCFLNEVEGIDINEKIIQSDIISINSEARAFVLNNKILDLAIYEGESDLMSATNFLNNFLKNPNVELPKSFVVDLGYNDKDGWFIIEFNSSWGSGLNSCNPNKIIQAIREATENIIKYFCPECKGTTFYVDYCDNPECPNMPCCGKPRELCDCIETGGKKI